MEDVCTKDMYIAALLLSYGSKVTRVDKKNPNRQFFHFDKFPTSVVTDLGNTAIVSFEELVSLFLSKKIYFPPSYVDCLRSVKTYIYQE